MVKFHQISKRSEGCRAGSGRVVSGRSVADSLFRLHPEQRARASREPKDGESCAAVCAFAPQSPQSPPSPEQTVEKLHGVGLCTTTGRFGGCGAQPLHRLGSRTRQIGRVRTHEMDASRRVRPVSCDFYQISSKIVHLQMRSAPQFHNFSSEIVHFQNRSEGCRTRPDAPIFVGNHGERLS